MTAPEQATLAAAPHEDKAVDEKPIDNSSPSDQNSLGSSDLPEWTQKEELRARTKVDSSVLPLLFLGLLVFQLDRMNIASALTAGFAVDIGVGQDTINLGNQLMFMGIVLLEIPSNILLQRLGPRWWISTQVFIFGLVAMLQFNVKNKAGFLASRLILGFSEAGYIPGAIYTLSTWYPRRELAKRVAVFFFGMFGGNALSPILASGILQLEGASGLRGWQWLFLLEGLFTIVVSGALFLLLPGSPDEPRPLLSPGLIRFTDREQGILRARLEIDDEQRKNGAQGLHIPWALVWKTVCHWRRWPHYVSTFAAFSTWSSLTTYTPSIIMALGFNRIAANALAAVGASLALVVVFLFAWFSDRTGKRGLSVVLAHICYLIALIVTRQVHPHVGKWSRWGLWTLVNSFAVGYHPVHNSWVQLNCREPGERSIAIAIYNTGLRTQIIMVSLGMLFAIIQDGVYFVHNRRVRNGQHRPKDGSEPYIYTL
ncbi:inner membrane transport protein yfaV [Plectosphaerella cucumerina]|uniref:Inner membrane transport protein yfaV n=1 Tax=Plectosphaerella cucumerina TaxID=40658 RepID=A0A8K0X509_9PEZI|nr:inner membrane transport protein yfaV [Plectosphaerella cucumerina]